MGMLPSSLPPLWLLCLGAVAATEFPPLSTSEPDLGTTTPLLRAEDESLLRVWEREPARVLEHIRAQQRRIGWLEHQLRKVVAKFDLDRGLQRSAVLLSRAQSGAKRETRHKSTQSNQRAVRTLEAPCAGCDACKVAADCYTLACQGGKMNTAGAFAQAWSE